ncbi:MAG: hypothetical protein AB9835_01390 [Eubacteriales bacterium]
MEKIINSIIEIEKQAQKIVAEAEQKRDSLPAEIKAALAQQREDSLKYADEIIAAYEAEVTEGKRRKIEEIDKTFTSRIEKLNQLSDMYFSSWVDTIYKGIIDRNASV